MEKKNGHLKVPYNKKVQTPDGAGIVIGGNFRENTNGGPGTRQLIVRLDDGRVRHYNYHAVQVIVNL